MLIVGVLRAKKVKTQRGNFPKIFCREKMRKGLCRRLVSFDTMGFEAILFFGVIDVFWQRRRPVLKKPEF